MILSVPILYLYPEGFSSSESSMNEMQKSSGDKESPWKISLLMLILLDIKVPLSCVRVNCVSQFFIFCFRKPITLGYSFSSSFSFFSSSVLLMVHDIYSSFDFHPSFEVRGIFLDISKAFDRVWHEGLLCKIKSIGISGTPLKLIENFLSCRYQRVLLNGQASSWSPILAGVLQGTILGSLFFLIFINDLSHNLSSTAKLFANDIPIFSVVHDIDSSTKTKQLNNYLKKISDWAYQLKMSFNPDLSEQAREVIFSRKSSRVDHQVVTFNNSSVARTSCQKHLAL